MTHFSMKYAPQLVHHMTQWKTRLSVHLTSIQYYQFYTVKSLKTYLNWLTLQNTKAFNKNVITLNYVQAKYSKDP